MPGKMMKPGNMSDSGMNDSGLPFGGDRAASAAIRGARTMGPGRPGVDMDVLEALMLSGEPNPNSVMPNTLTNEQAQRMMADARMASMLQAIQNSQRIPSPVTR